MKNLKIGVRLGLAFGLMVVLITGMAVFSYLQLGKIKTDVDEMTKVAFPKMEAGSDSLEFIQNVCRSVV